MRDTATRWAAARRVRVAGRNPFEVAVRTMSEVIDDRVSGLAAEMAFFALLSFAPLLVTLGAALGYLERFVDAAEIAKGEQLVIRLVGTVFNEETTAEVFAPLVRGLLHSERGGLAITGLVVTLYLASRVFTATIRALDMAYDTPERRGALAQRLLAVGFAVGFVVAVTVTLGVLVVGPLLGVGRAAAGALGRESAFASIWGVGRWPVVVILVVAFLTSVYRFGPNVSHTWLQCLPGAVLGVILWLLASVALRVYLDAGGGGTTLRSSDAAVALVGNAVGAVVAAVLWVYLTSIVILVGGELNAELRRDTPAP
jgi:membrane protein